MRGKGGGEGGEERGEGGGGGDLTPRSAGVDATQTGRKVLRPIPIFWGPPPLKSTPPHCICHIVYILFG